MEFLLLAAPAVAAIGATISVAWIGHTKTQLRIVANEAALVAAEADTSVAEATQWLNRKLEPLVGVPRSTQIDVSSPVVELEISIAKLPSLSTFTLLIPQQRITAYAAKEF